MKENLTNPNLIPSIKTNPYTLTFMTTLHTSITGQIGVCLLHEKRGENKIFIFSGKSNISKPRWMSISLLYLPKNCFFFLFIYILQLVINIWISHGWFSHSLCLCLHQLLPFLLKKKKEKKWAPISKGSDYIFHSIENHIHIYNSL